MSTVKTTNLQHPSASDVGITLGADGSVVLPQGFTGGVGSNVVQTVKTDTFTTTSTSYTIITGLSASITPKTATNKVLVLVNVPISQNSGDNSNAVHLAVFRGATNLVAASSPSNRIPTFVAHRNQDDLAQTMASTSFFVLDSPNSATSQTYEVHIKTNGAAGTPTAMVNRSKADTDTTAFPRGVASITVIEVAV